MSVFGGIGGVGPAARGDRSLALPLLQTLRLAWADPDLKGRLIFVLGMLAVFAFGIHVPAPIPGHASQAIRDTLTAAFEQIPALAIFNIFSGGALRKLSIFALGLGPYITASIIMQVLTAAFPQWKKELQEGGQYARQQQNRRSKMLTLFLCFFQGFGLLQFLSMGLTSVGPISLSAKIIVVLFWTAGSMFMLWLGEQISEKGIGNGVSIMIFAGIIISMPFQFTQLWKGVTDGVVQYWQLAALIAIFLIVTWLIVFFTVAQRRIPIQHMRRSTGTRMVGGQTSYLPFSVNMVGVIPIIFASSLLFLPSQIGMMFPNTGFHTTMNSLQEYLSPGSAGIKGVIGALAYTMLIFFFSYFYTAVQYNVEDISNNLKRGGSFIPGVRPGKQTREFLDGVISRITLVGAVFISFVALIQYIAPGLVRISSMYVSVISGVSLLIMVSVALETMRQLEANIMMKQYGP